MAERLIPVKSSERILYLKKIVEPLDKKSDTLKFMPGYDSSFAKRPSVNPFIKTSQHKYIGEVLNYKPEQIAVKR